MQCHSPLSGETMRLGVPWSPWNGQSPFQFDAPALHQGEEIGSPFHLVDVGVSDARHQLSPKCVKPEAKDFDMPPN
jgi:hypothetical protein